jgi:uncharacterized iron-regulated protein
MRFRFAAVVLVVAAVAGCRSVAPPPMPAWTAPLDRDHPLVGRIWDVRRERVVDERALVRDLASARFVLLGEKHDNPDHHALQARLLQALVDAGRRPTVAWEMLTPAQAAALGRHLAERPRDSAGLGPAVGWERSGWPEWRLYEPIARAAMLAGLPMVAANLDDTRLRAMRRDGVGALDPALVARYGLDAPLAGDVQAAMSDEIREAHCGHASPAAVGTMVAMQRARDATLADALAAAPAADGAVLIAGSGHARTDRAVPAHLRRVAPGARTVAVALLEVDPAKREAPQYERGGTLPFDYVWFTPATTREDPCVRFRQQIERLRR